MIQRRPRARTSAAIRFCLEFQPSELELFSEVAGGNGKRIAPASDTLRRKRATQRRALFRLEGMPFRGKSDKYMRFNFPLIQGRINKLATLNGFGPISVS